MKHFEIRPDAQAFGIFPRESKGKTPARFSPLLNGLLGCTLKDGLCKKTAFQLLRDVYPYVQGSDAALIEDLLRARDRFLYVTLHPLQRQPACFRRPLKPRDRLLGLLEVFSRYGGRRAQSTFEKVRRALLVRDRMEEQELLGLLPMLGAEDMAARLGGWEEGEKGMNGNFGDMMRMMQLLQGMNGGSRGGNLEQMMGMMQTLGGKSPSQTGGGMEQMMQMMQMMQGMQGMSPPAPPKNPAGKPKLGPNSPGKGPANRRT